MDPEEEKVKCVIEPIYKRLISAQNELFKLRPDRKHVNQVLNICFDLVDFVVKNMRVK